jgi:outer membrane lipoprotein-sorting protein
VVAICLALVLGLGLMTGHRSSSRAALAMAAEAMSRVRNVHYVGRQQIAGTWSPFDVKVEFPDRRRWESPGQSIAIEDGDRELLVLPQRTTLPWHPVPYRYVLRHVSELSKRGRTSDLFSYPERLRLLSRQSKPVRTETVALPDGAKVLLVEVRSDEPDRTSTDIVTINPTSHLVLGWQTETKWKSDGVWRVWRAEVDRVEYNTDLPDELFSTEPPPGEEVLDQYSQEGMRASLEHMLDQVESLHGEDRATLIKEINDNDAFWQVRRVAPESQKPIRERMQRLGIVTRGE